MRLRVMSGKRQGDLLEVGPGEHVIGTGKSSELQLRDAEVSFKHARLSVVGDEAFLEDLKSKHGTFVNGERIDQRVPLRHLDQVQIGAAGLRIELQEVAAPPPAAHPTPGAQAPGHHPAAEDGEELADDPELLRGLVRQLRRQLREKTQEAKALEEALDARLAAAGPEDEEGGYLTPGARTDLEARLLELERQLDERTAESLEKSEELRLLADEQARAAEARQRKAGDVEREVDALSRQLLDTQERLAQAAQEVAAARAEAARYEQKNAELALEAEELQERVDALRHVSEEEAAARGALVRERVSDLRRETAKVLEQDARMRATVEAYEEKLDELDERVEELEGENEALERLVADLRAELTQARNERETTVKTLRQKLQRLEQRVEEVQQERARAEAAALRDTERRAEPPAPMLHADRRPAQESSTS